MNLSNLEFIQLLPMFMRDDDAVKGLAAGVDEVIPQLSDSLSTLSTWLSTRYSHCGTGFTQVLRFLLQLQVLRLLELQEP